jgi:hypothetical protein
VKEKTARGVVAAVVGDGSDRAQQAVAAAILGTDDLAPGSAVAAAAQRFAALAPGARRAWLLAHASDLRAGRIALGQLP